MSTLCGSQFEDEIDEISRLAKIHIQKYYKTDRYDCIDRIFVALTYAIAETLEIKED